MTTMKKALILDTTLREGEQTPGVAFTRDQKLRIATALDEIGVDMIELGHPAVSRDIAAFISDMAKGRFHAELVAHARACGSDIDAALATGVGRVAVFIGASKNHLEKKHGSTVKNAAELVYRSVRTITQSGVKARFTAEDASRAYFDGVLEICRAAADAGADRISLPDTVGIALPDEIRALFRKMRKEFGEVGLDAHCHNDLGMAIANSLAAYEGGADCLHVTVNGLGERAGIAPLSNIAVALKILYGVDGVDLAKLHGLTQMVAKFSGVTVPANLPVVGENVFSHKAGVHTAGVLKDPSTYEPFSPDLINRDRKLVVDRFTGRNAVRERFKRLGIEMHDDDLTGIVETIKNSSRAGAYTDDDLLRLKNHSTGGQHHAEEIR